MALEQDLKENNDLGVTKERRKLKRLWFYLAALLVLLVLTGLLNYRKLADIYHLYRLKSQLAQEMEAIKKENLRLSKEIKSLQEDNASLEEQARKDLNMVKPGEVIYQPQTPAPKEENIHGKK